MNCHQRNKAQVVVRLSINEFHRIIPFFSAEAMQSVINFLIWVSYSGSCLRSWLQEPRLLMRGRPDCIMSCEERCNVLMKRYSIIRNIVAGVFAAFVSCSHHYFPFSFKFWSCNHVWRHVCAFEDLAQACISHALPTMQHLKHYYCCAKQMKVDFFYTSVSFLVTLTRHM